MTKRFFHRVCVTLLSAVIAISATGAGAVSEFSRAWQSPNSSIVLDAYEYTVIDWSKIKNNQRLAGFINKATEGLRPRSRCNRNSVCRLRWRRYAAAKELYHTRKTLAKTLGLKWGAYHLGRPGNPIKQARHFLEFAKPGPDDLVAIDIEENNPKRWMSLKEAEVFSQYIYEKLGRYPVLYTNHSTARYIARNRAELPLLSRLNLWYARYRPSMTRAFPMGNWDSYTIWQFSAHTNCSPQSCLWRIDGTDHWIDVNVVNMAPAELRRKWPFNELTARMPSPPKPEKPGGEAVLTALTGYAEKPKVISATKMFEALLSKPQMVLRGKVPLPNWRPVVAVADSQPAAETEPTPRFKTVAKEMVAKISAPNTQMVNALLLETAKSYQAASLNGNADWSSTTPVAAARIASKPKNHVATLRWRPETKLTVLEAPSGPEIAKPVVAVRVPVMAVKGTVATPHWRPETVLADAAAIAEPDVGPVPVVAPVMAVNGIVALPKWRPESRVAQIKPVKSVIVVAPKMAVTGLVAKPRWRPGAKIRRLAGNSSSKPVKIASSSSYVIPAATGTSLLRRATTPSWRPNSS
jgi:GH25 family lysozyme M1 (1,4-beta-N-acetylmuramidase)